MYTVLLEEDYPCPDPLLVIHLLAVPYTLI